MTYAKKDILDALSYVVEPDLKKDIVTLGLVSEISIDDNTVSFKVQVQNPAMHNKKRIEEACEHQITERVSKELAVNASIVPMEGDNKEDISLRKVLPNVKNIVAVASGKGGVGKSTVTSNLAAGLAKLGFRVGLIDADIYGPSMPIMFDVENQKPQATEVDGKTKIRPIESYGVKMLSIGFFVDVDQAIVWRGPMVTKALNQMINDVDWGELDYMIIDLPPGTGDVHLSLVQGVPLSGAVVVSTPQNVALSDAKKGVGMFRLESINVPVLGIVENMSWFTPEELPENKYYLFGKDGAKDLATDLNVPLLAQIPLIQSVREASDVGRPAVLQEDTPQARVFEDMVKAVVEGLSATE